MFDHFKLIRAEIKTARYPNKKCVRCAKTFSKDEQYWEEIWKDQKIFTEYWCIQCDDLYETREEWRTGDLLDDDETG